jgi:hypothetical protein
MSDLTSTLRGHLQCPRLQVGLLSQDRSPVDYTPGRVAKTATSAAQAGALPHHGPASAAPATVQSALLDARVHVQPPTTAPPSSVRPR